MIELQPQHNAIEIDLVWELGGAYEARRRAETGDERAKRAAAAIERVLLEVIQPAGTKCAGCARPMRKLGDFACIGVAHFYANPEKAMAVTICRRCATSRDKAEHHVRAALLTLPRVNGSTI